MSLILVGRRNIATILYIRLVQGLSWEAESPELVNNDFLSFFSFSCERACFSMLFCVLVAALLSNNPPFLI